MNQEALMIIGFLLGSYSIVGNDAIQTLGTFLSSNSHRPWWVLWLFACGVLTAVLVHGWWAHGDVSYGRLQAIPVPERFTWIYSPGGWSPASAARRAQRVPGGSWLSDARPVSSGASG